MIYWIRPLPERTVVHRLACRMAWRGKFGHTAKLADIKPEWEDCRICGGRYKERK